MGFQGVLTNIKRGSLLTLFGLMAAGNAHATYPNIVNTYTGTFAVTNTGCSYPEDNGPDSGTVSININSQITNSFSGGGSLDSIETITSFGGSILNAAGSVSGSFASSHPDGTMSSGSFTGVILGGGLYLAISGSDNSSCHFTGYITAGGPVAFEAEDTAGSNLTSLSATSSATNSNSSVIGSYVKTALGTASRGETAITGVRAIPNGFQVESGLNAGSDFQYPIGLWGGYTRTDSSNDFTLTKFDSTRHSFMGGVDFKPYDSTVAGVALGYEWTDVDTKFNRGNQDLGGYTIAPYFGIIIGNLAGYDITGDAMIGYSSIEIDQDRLDPTTSAKITGNTDNDRKFWAAHLTASRMHGNWFVSGQLGIQYSNSEINQFTESNGVVNADSVVSQSQWSLGAETAYAMGDWEPFGSLSYEKDYRLTKITLAGAATQPSSDNDQIRGGLGLRYFAKDGMSGSFEVNKVFSRTDYDEVNVNLNVRVDF